jgi:hypothetical protein
MMWSTVRPIRVESTMYKRVTLVLAAVLLTALSGCAAQTASNSAADGQPASVQAGAPGQGTFDTVAQETSKLIAADARWHAPGTLEAGETDRIGLSVGTGTTLTSKINTYLKGTSNTPAGSVLVGPSVRVSLHADSGDAEITPSEAVDASTSSDVQMLWTWLVHPTHPTKQLLLTAWLDVPLSDGHTIHHELPLTLEVKRTFGYTATQVFTHLATWSAIGATLVSVAGWLWRRRRKIAVQS